MQEKVSFARVFFWKFELRPPEKNLPDDMNEHLEMYVVGDDYDDVESIKDEQTARYGVNAVVDVDFYEVSKNQLNGVFLAKKDGIIGTFKIDRYTLPPEMVSDVYREKLQFEV